jgi:hypothetical protein
MSRLLFAAARGARIQALDKNLGAILSSHAPLELSNDKRPYRIHPDDAHLQYGPISTALRLRGGAWEAISRGKYKLGFFKADTPQKAIALAVIGALK